MRSVAVAADAEKRLRKIRSWLGSTAFREVAGGREILIVAPARGAADELLRRACPAGGGLFGAHRLTLRQLAADLATRSLAERGLAPVSVLGTEALAARAISIRAGAGELDYFAPVADAPGFARALASTLRELRAGAVDAASLAATGPPGADLARLLETFTAELDRWSLVDGAGLLELARRQAERGEHRLVGLPLVLLDLSPTAREEQLLLASLIAAAPAALAVAQSGDAPGIAALEEVFVAAGRPDPGRPDPTGPDPAEDLDLAEVAGGAPSGSLERLRRRIFLPHLEDGITGGGGTEREEASVEFLSAPGEGRECVEIARRIRLLAAAGGERVAFDGIAVLLRDPEGYLPLVEEALRRAGVPAYFTRGATRPHPAGRALLSLLACAAERLSATRFAEYLSLGQVPLPDASGAPPVVEVPWVAPEGDQLVFKTLMPAEPETAAAGAEGAGDGAGAGESDRGPAAAGTLRVPRQWQRLLVDAAVLGGRERWRRRLSGLAAEIRLQLEGLDSDDHPHRRRLERRLEHLGHLERFALPVIELLDELPQAAVWGEWLDRLSALASRVLRQSEKVLSVLAELRPMDRVGPVTLDEVRRVLEERLTVLRSEPPERPYGRVFVATVAEARGRSFEVVFLPGLAEGIFPRRASEDPLLLDDERRKLTKASPLPTQKERVEEERLLLRLAAGAARSRLVVSYPNLDALQGRSRVPSFYALDLLRAAEGRLPDLGELEGRAAAASRSLLGWPAPRSPDAAIDAAEYDLSVLEPLLRGAAADAAARGRYLLESNERLARSLRTRWRRWRPSFSPADGVVDPGEGALAALAEHRLDRRSYSPTALQRYAACPYRFLLAAVHRLRPREEAAWLERLDPLTRGSLFHRVQFELFRDLEERELLPFNADDLAALLERADRVLDRVAERYREELAPAIPRVWASEIEGLRTDLRGWINTVVEAAEPWRPAWFEFAFGLDRDGAGAAEAPPAAEAVQFSLALDGAPPPEARPEAGSAASPEALVLDGKRLRGAIDLVEVHEERGTLRITDHKTGAPPRGRRLVVGGGETLQPLLYALAAESLLGRPAEAGRLFFCTRRGRYEAVEVALDDKGREAASLALQVVDRALRDGFLPAAPRAGACRFCDYHAVCGPFEELRIRRKHPQRLTLLAQLRNLP